jgi:hypothetical protein
MKAEAIRRCDRWTMSGSFMTFGPQEWKQCQNPATKHIVFKKKHGRWNVKEAFACDSCYIEFLKEYQVPHSMKTLSQGGSRDASKKESVQEKGKSKVKSKGRS